MPNQTKNSHHMVKYIVRYTPLKPFFVNFASITHLQQFTYSLQPSITTVLFLHLQILTKILHYVKMFLKILIKSSNICQKCQFCPKLNHQIYARNVNFAQSLSCFGFEKKKKSKFRLYHFFLITVFYLHAKY